MGRKGGADSSLSFLRQKTRFSCQRTSMPFHLMEEVLSLSFIPFECVEDGIFLSASRLNIQVGAQPGFSVFLDLFSFPC
jgi:hypothetical protein